MAERFTFFLITLLTDIASSTPDAAVRDKILTAQVELLTALTAVLASAAATAETATSPSKSMFFPIVMK